MQKSITALLALALASAGLLALAQGDLQVKETALARNLAHEPGADQKPAQHLPGRCPRARPERIAAAIAYQRCRRRRPRGCGCRRGKASAAHLCPALDG